jgi:hypothetical protein
MLFTLLTLPPAVMADRTYDFQFNPGVWYGQPWTLSGTITTDGTIGTIQATNILFWTWTLTNGVSSFTASSTDPYAGMSTITEGAGVNTMPGITATGAGLFLPVPSSDVPYRFTLYAPPDQLMWQTNAGGTTQFSIFDYSAEIDGGWLENLAGGAGSAWQFASASPVAVPEPSSLYIVGFGAVCVYVMGHKRRARRTATTDV